MNALEAVLGVLLTPIGVPTVLFVLLLVGMRWRLPFTAVGAGVLGLALAVAAAGLALASSALFVRASSAEVAPALALALGSAVVTWISVRDLRSRPAGHGATGPWAGPTTADLWRSLAIVAGLVVLAMLVPVPAGFPADGVSVPDPIRPPWWAAGWMELSSVVRPPLAFAILSLVALAALPWLSADPGGEDADSTRTTSALDERRYGIRLYLFGWWILGVAPMVVGTWLRGSGWRPLGLDGRPAEGAAWSRSLAEWLWLEVLRVGTPDSPVARELPGLVVLGSVFVVLPVALLRRGRGRGIARRYRRALGRTRFALGIVLALAMVLLALKIWLLAAFRLRALVDLPELGVVF